jgi:hypothetical protein
VTAKCLQVVSESSKARHATFSTVTLAIARSSLEGSHDDGSELSAAVKENMTSHTINSPQIYARIGGALYLFIIIASL